MIRRLALLVTTAALLVTTAVPAAAHVELESSDPAEGATVAAPTTVTLTFTGEVTASKEAIRITARDGSDWTVSSVKADGDTVTATVTPKGPAGPHGMTYRVTSTDGHTLSGTIRFTVTAPTTTAPPTTTTTTSAPTTEVSAAAQADNTAPAEEGGWPAWLWVLLAAALVAVGFLVFRSRKSA